MSNEKGTTLLELLVVLAMTVILMAGLMSIYTFATAANKREMDRTDVYYAARQSREWIIGDFRTYSNFRVLDNYSHKAEVTVGEIGNCLELKMGPAGKPQTVYYYVNDSNKQLYKDAQDPTSNQPVASNIKKISFSRPSVTAPGLLHIKIEVKIGNHEYSLENNCKKRVD